MKKLMNIKIILFSVLSFTFSIDVFAQQFPYASPFSEMREVWNPAYTGFEDEVVSSIYVRQQWLGIGTKRAPRMVYASLQYPFKKQNMSLGGALYSDKAGPITNNSIVINYAYSLKSLLLRKDQLSLGIKARATQFGFDATEEIYREGGDPLVLTNRNTAFYPSVGAGLLYITNPRHYEDNSFFIGASFLQAVTTNLLVQNNSFERELHLFGQIGTRIYNLNSYWEISSHVNYTFPQILDIILNVRFDYNDVFWTGISYSTVNDIFVQGGFYVRDLGNNDAYMKLGILGNINVTQSLIAAGPGLELFVSYNY